MGLIRNMVTAGDYKGANIIYKAFSEKIYLEAKGILAGKIKVELIFNLNIPPIFIKKKIP